MSEKRYIQLADKIMSRVASGDWQIGETLPPENTLSVEYQVSRSTVRLALSRLENWGMVSRKRKRGTVLVSDSPKQILQRQVGSLELLDEFAQRTQLNIIEFNDRTGQSLSEEHELEVMLEGRWIEYLGSRCWVTDDTVVSWTRFAFDSLYEGAKDLISKSRQPTFRIIEDAFRLKICAITQHVRATAVFGDVAELLQLPDGSPALEVKRLMYEERQRPIIHAHSIHRADAVSMNMRMELGSEQMGR